MEEGILIYVREDIPSKELYDHNFPEDIEGIFLEINLRKVKWLLLGSYHAPSQQDTHYFQKGIKFFRYLFREI